jgi:hypothetical protein
MASGLTRCYGLQIKAGTEISAGAVKYGDPGLVVILKGAECLRERRGGGGIDGIAPFRPVENHRGNGASLFARYAHGLPPDSRAIG